MDYTRIMSKNMFFPRFKSYISTVNVIIHYGTYLYWPDDGWIRSRKLDINVIN
jgi:hypothetical protein